MDDGLTDSERNRRHAIATGSTIVEAVGIAVGFHEDYGDPRLRAIELDMVQACREAQRQGINDPESIRGRIIAARDAAKDRG